MTTGTGRRLELRLPLPPSTLNPNGARGGYVQLRNGKRFYPRSQAATEYRGTCRIEIDYANVAALRAWDAVPFYFARLSFRFRWCTGRRAWDADNALSAMKPAIDCLRDVKILRDDGAKRVTYGSVESVHCPPKCRCGGYVAVVVEELTP